MECVESVLVRRMLMPRAFATAVAVVVARAILLVALNLLSPHSDKSCANAAILKLAHLVTDVFVTATLAITVATVCARTVPFAALNCKAS